MARVDLLWRPVPPGEARLAVVLATSLDLQPAAHAYSVLKILFTKFLQ